MASRAANVAKAAVLGIVAGFITGYLMCVLVLPPAADAVDRALGCGACAALAGLIGAFAGAATGRGACKERGEDGCETRF